MDVQAIAKHRGEFHIEDNPAVDMTGTSPASSAVAAVFTLAQSRQHVVKGGAGRLNVDAQITLNAPFHGPAYGYDQSRGGLALVPSFSSATTAVLDAVSTDGVEVTDVFIGNPSALSVTDALSGIGLRLGRPGQSPETTYKSARYSIRRTRVYGMTTGYSVQGWTGTMDTCHAQYCGVGFIGEYLNACKLDLRLAENTKDFAITNSDTLELFALMEGSLASSQAATIDNCRGGKWVFYLEHATNNRSTPMLTIGGTTECQGIDVVITVGANMDLSAGYRPVRLDKVNGGRVIVVGSSGSMHGLVETTSNTKNVEIVYAATLGAWPLDNAKQFGPAYNYFPNSNFECWVAGSAAPRGWYDMAVSANVTLSQRDAVSGHATHRGRYAIRLTASSTGKQNRSVTFTLGEPSSQPSRAVIALRGKTIRTGMWVWIPSTAEFAESDLGNQHCNVILNTSSYNGSATVDGSLLNGDYSHHTSRGQWNFLWTDTVVQVDATRIIVNVYLQTAGSGGSIVTAADAYIDIDSIQICEATVPLNQLMAGLPDAPSIDAVCEGGKVRFFTAVDGASTDATQYFGVGDVLEKLAPTSGASWRSVCVTAGAGGTAGNWKSEQALP